MSNLDFPGNYDYYLRSGQKALEDHRPKDGIVQLEAAYQIKQEPIVNWLIATTAFELGDYKKSLSYIVELPDFYMEEENRAELYLQNLLMSKQYLSARKLLWEIQKLGKLDKDKVQSFEQLIDMQEAFYQQTQKSMILEIKQEMAELPHASAVYQLQIVQRVKELPQADLIEVSNQLMVNPKVSPLVRNFLFEELVNTGTKDLLSILAIDGSIHTLSPEKIGISASNPLKNDILNGLEEILENKDPVLLTSLMEEAKVELALLYPLYEQYENSRFWVNSYLSEYLNQEYPLNEKVEEIRKKIKQEINGFYQG
ncbi:hypothetical protein JZO70_04785 [Enterococcus sp. 669A]|uniref:TPR repeat-containing protein n=1 Tax=Candidatus Enterococcus moelleringii TaxID=2815325 RepID=A0ABS3L8S5_9ENTE|nr:hypothetical protein [Enterococcus sp. 669A]MBO1305463.1 hypothetical protein [Enterococcus sp. 669A]